MIRKPIVSIMGHVDHGKTSILDSIRKTNLVSREAGSITQHIGATEISFDLIKEQCGDSIKNTIGENFPGLLFIDTPGHAAFTSLRKRGGNLADIAILVIDINEGFKPQTIEAIEILKSYKTPFIIACNKIDLIPGWNLKKGSDIISSINSQIDSVVKIFETKMYEIVGKLYEMGFKAERFDRVSNFSDELALVPISAKHNFGLNTLLMMVGGLAQKFLEKSLEVHLDAPAEGIVLEVKEEQGLGTIMNVLIFDGTIKKNDILIIGDVEETKVSKVKSLLIPKTVGDIRDKKTKFISVNSVQAAAGIKISGSDLNGVLSGMPFKAAKNELEIESIKDEISSQIEEVFLDVNKDGCIIKADTIGSLEALLMLCKEHNINVRKASIGNINQKDIIEAGIDTDLINRTILGFNIKCDVSHDDVKLILSDVIYSIIDQMEEHKNWAKIKDEQGKLKGLNVPSKIELLPQFVFRTRDPVIVGVKILDGKLTLGTKLMKSDGSVIGEVKGIKKGKESIKFAIAGDEVAVSMTGFTLGRQVLDDDVLFTSLNEETFLKYKELKKYVPSEYKSALSEIAKIMREKNPVWGI
ncbi:translation initiation factor IF-2 [Candidatus Woesearchaeota archaeon]|jgi:translation initiation factor 5B|nr:translation initiation factor IF-2 [Candidatus Woesearchaeota archaeon]MBT4595589.1 translation initiation factor IF-2 [Candidatus Woesearchaeota archaeon]MBT5740928.1 translation initiation factor IF-2 [Candidatus Woesearchaeota archaeon]MBT6505530.1 translation initiation factor IF-2 [Candidatus Woesearchaeota archaeon]MBT7296881.1 translation initiation factor IF-2 [Candidatus Woesearchaeota archaeon]